MKRKEGAAKLEGMKASSKKQHSAQGERGITSTSWVQLEDCNMPRGGGHGLGQYSYFQYLTGG
jgi:hypothetical protein